MDKPIEIDKAAKLKKIFDQTVLFMSEPEALAIIGTWIAHETQTRKYKTVIVKELSEALIILKQSVNENIESNVVVSEGE